MKTYVACFSPGGARDRQDLGGAAAACGGGDNPFTLRVGIHCGSGIGGVVDMAAPRFSVFGSNLADVARGVARAAEG